MQSRRAIRALDRQLDYQRAKAESAGHDVDHVFEAHAAAVLAEIRAVCPLAPGCRVIEIGSGAHGIIFFAGLSGAIGIDPLAVEYASLFPRWQSKARTVQGAGEALPFADAAFDLVLSDNVVDHASDPGKILAEAARVLRPGGALFFSVNVHHPFWAAASELYGAAKALGVPGEIPPFADHTVHLTPRAARALVSRQAFRIVAEKLPIAEERSRERMTPTRHVGDYVKRVFFKNVRYEAIALRELRE